MAKEESMHATQNEPSVSEIDDSSGDAGSTGNIESSASDIDDDEEEECSVRTLSMSQWRKFETGVPTSAAVRRRTGRAIAPLSMLTTNKHRHLIGSVARPVEPIDLRWSDVKGPYVREQLMVNLYRLKELAASNETPFIAEKITSAVAGCALWSGWRLSTTKPSYANYRGTTPRSYSVSTTVWCYFPESQASNRPKTPRYSLLTAWQSCTPI